MRARLRSGTAALGLVALAAALLAPLPASAADGPPPASAETRVLSKVHTDAVSTFLDDGALALGTRADVDGALGTRFEAEEVVFDIDDGARTSVPAGAGFVAPEGTVIWLAPEGAPSAAGGYSTLWPGFSTDGVPAGAVVGDTTTFTLESVTGPGDVEVWTASRRLWSSDEPIRSFDLGRTHMHANWAFTAAGSYELTVRADAATAAGPVSASAVYTFVVGGVPAPVATTTSLTVGTATAVVGEPVELAATVQPAGAQGWVEFLDGTTSLGHDAVEGSAAAITVSDLPLGVRSLTARFSPRSLDDFAVSTSPPQVVTVTQDAGGQVFGVGGLRAEYAAGETIDLRPVGVTLAPGQSFSWEARSADDGTEYGLSAPSPEGNGRYLRDATTALDGAQLAVTVRESYTDDAGRERTREIQRSPWVTVEVRGADVGTGEPLRIVGVEQSYVRGDAVRLGVEGRPLGEGESLRWVSRYLPYQNTWEETYVDYAPVESDGLFVGPADLLNTAEAAVQLVAADGAVLGQSPAIASDFSSREVIVSGLRPIYRAGDTMQLTTVLDPAADRPASDFDYQWSVPAEGGWPLIPIDGATQSTLSTPVTAEMNGSYVYLDVTDRATGYWVASASVLVRITDAAPGEQIVVIDGLQGHYHQGWTVDLTASADPIAASTDTYRWSWKRPDQVDFAPIPDLTGPRFQVRAQQALAGAEVKVELLTAEGELIATSEVATIEHDDHGGAPQEKVMLTGVAEAYTVGDTIDVVAEVAPESVLTTWIWYLQRAGEESPSVVEGASGPSVSLAATDGLDGAVLSASLAFDDGRVHLRSAPTTLRVTAAAEPEVPGLPEAPGVPEVPGVPGGSEPVSPTDPQAPGQQPAPETGSAGDAAADGSTRPVDSVRSALPSTGVDSNRAGLVALLLLAAGGSALLLRRMRPIGSRYDAARAINENHNE